MVRTTIVTTFLALSLCGSHAWAQRFEEDLNRDMKWFLERDDEPLEMDRSTQILKGIDLDFSGDQAKEIRQLKGLLVPGFFTPTTSTWLEHSGSPGLSDWTWESRFQQVTYTSDYMRQVPLSFTDSLETNDLADGTSSLVVEVDLDDFSDTFGPWAPGPGNHYAYYVVLQGVHFDANTSMGPVALWAAAEVTNTDNRPDSDNLLFIDLSSRFRGPFNTFHYDITYTMELIGIDTRVWGVEKVDASYRNTTSTTQAQYVDEVTVDLDAPLYWPPTQGDVSGMFVGLASIGHDYDTWSGDVYAFNGTSYPHDLYEIDRWFSRVSVVDFDPASERAAVRFTGATHGFHWSIPNPNRVFNMPHSKTSAYLFYCRYPQHAEVSNFTDSGAVPAWSIGP
jgi:hypothetical protein